MARAKSDAIMRCQHIDYELLLVDKCTDTHDHVFETCPITESSRERELTYPRGNRGRRGRMGGRREISGHTRDPTQR